MVKEIIWSNEILVDIEEILSYWSIHNSSNVFSDKLLSEIYLHVDLIQKIPTIGNVTTIKNIRGKIVLKHFYIFYQETNTAIHLLRFWDGRRNPQSISFG